MIGYWIILQSTFIERNCKETKHHNQNTVPGRKNGGDYNGELFVEVYSGENLRYNKKLYRKIDYRKIELFGKLIVSFTLLHL